MISKKSKLALHCLSLYLAVVRLNEALQSIETSFLFSLSIALVWV